MKRVPGNDRQQGPARNGDDLTLGLRRRGVEQGRRVEQATTAGYRVSRDGGALLFDAVVAVEIVAHLDNPRYLVRPLGPIRASSLRACR